MDLTPAEKQLVASLGLLYCFSDKEKNPNPSWSGHDIALLIGGRWSTYRHKTMSLLQERGFVTIKKRAAHWYYGLTDQALQDLQSVISSVKAV